MKNSRREAVCALLNRESPTHEVVVKCPKTFEVTNVHLYLPLEKYALLVFSHSPARGTGVETQVWGVQGERLHRHGKTDSRCTGHPPQHSGQPDHLCRSSVLGWRWKRNNPTFPTLCNSTKTFPKPNLIKLQPDSGSPTVLCHTHNILFLLKPLATTNPLKDSHPAPANALVSSLRLVLCPP